MKARYLLFFIFCGFLSVLSHAKGRDAVLLRDSTKVFGKITYISDFILHMEVNDKERSFFSDDVDYVMLSPGNFFIAQKIKAEAFSRERDFEELMEEDMLFGFRFILGTDPMVNKYAIAKDSEKAPRSMKGYVYEIKDKTLKDRVRSVGKKSTLPAILVIMLMIL